MVGIVTVVAKQCIVLGAVPCLRHTRLCRLVLCLMFAVAWAACILKFSCLSMRKLRDFTESEGRISVPWTVIPVWPVFLISSPLDGARCISSALREEYRIFGNIPLATL